MPLPFLLYLLLLRPSFLITLVAAKELGYALASRRANAARLMPTTRALKTALHCIFVPSVAVLAMAAATHDASQPTLHHWQPVMAAVVELAEALDAAEAVATKAGSSEGLRPHHH